ncbi:MAG TPA: ribonuclease HII [Gemmatimonadales bacterium]|jgi:ribonuclease HII|nr:ribonuclease HII [Gemmatimonadales bacterium]
MAVRPSLKRERAAWAEELLLVGVDEAGRGPLAGPVVAAAVVFPARCSAVRGLRDSKVLPARVRLRLAIRIRERALAFAVGAASSREIDRLNIRVATALAMRRAIARLITRGPFAGTRVPHRILIDGLPLPEIGFEHDALVDGDARCQSIAAAAILAKTVRDRLMHQLAPRYPGYGWDTNVGYGTEEHHVGLQLHGPTRHHRFTFAPLAQLSLFA